MKYAIFETRLGFFGLLSAEKAILRTSLPEKSYKTAETDLLVGLISAKEDKNLHLGLQNQIIEYYHGTRLSFDYPIEVNLDSLTDFSRKILLACRKIPYGKTASYTEVSIMAGRPKSPRAAGNALANNPLPLIIPCHRVIKSDGSTGGFQKNKPGAVNLKTKMLQLEQQISRG